MAVDFSAIFSAQDRVSKQLNKIDSTGSKLTGTFKKLATTVAGVMSIAAVVSFGKESTQAFTNFENSMNEVFTLLPDISGQAMTAMSAQAKQSTIDMGRLPEDVVPTLYQALSAGVPQDTVFSFLETANKAAVGGVTTLETAVDGLSSVVNAYGSDILSTDKASNLMFTAVKLGKTTFDELAASLFNVNPTAAAANISFDQVSASLAAMTAQGIPTSVATTQLRQAFLELSTSGTATDKIFRQIAGGGFKDFLAKGNDIQDAFQLMESYAAKSNLGINDLFSSAEAKSAVLALTGKNTQRFTDALNAMAQSAGATDAAFAKMEKGFQRKLDKMNAKLAVLKINAGEKIVGAILNVWDKADPVLQKLQSGYEKTVAVLKEKGFASGIEAIFGADAGKIASNAENYGRIFVDSFKKILEGGASAGEGATNILQALGFTPKSIANINDFALSVIKTLGMLKAQVKPTFDSWVLAAKTIIPVFKDIDNFFVQTFLPIFKNVFDFAVSNVIMPFLGFFQANMPKIASIISNVWMILKPILTATADHFTKLFNIAKFVFTGVAGVALDMANSLLTILNGITAFIAGVFSHNWEQAWGGVVDIFKGLFSPIGKVIKTSLNAAISEINKFLGGLGSIKIPDWVPKFGGQSFSIPQIPMLAKGATYAPDAYIAGEAGPELITGGRGSRVFPFRDTSRILSGFNRAISEISSPMAEKVEPEVADTGSDRNINININGNGEIGAKGMSKADVLELLITNIKPVLLEIIETEIYEEGDFAYDF